MWPHKLLYDTAMESFVRTQYQFSECEALTFHWECLLMSGFFSSSFFYHLMLSQAGSWLFFVLRSSGEPKQFFICAVVNLYFWGELTSRGNTKRELCRKGSLIGTQGGDRGRQSYGLSEVRCSKVRLYWVKPWRAWLAFCCWVFFFTLFCSPLFLFFLYHVNSELSFILFLSDFAIMGMFVPQSWLYWGLCLLYPCMSWQQIHLLIFQMDAWEYF